MMPGLEFEGVRFLVARGLNWGEMESLADFIEHSCGYFPWRWAPRST